MKAKEAPEKLYITYKGYGVFDEDSAVERTNDSQTEYTRTDTFIKKAVKHIDGLIEFLNEFGHQLKKERIIENFKKYMSE